MPFPQHWTTERTRIANVIVAEAEALTALFNANVDVAEMDPTFRAGDMKEVLGHIDESVRCEPLERGFRMQSVRLASTNELIGYFHFSEAKPRPDIVGLSMFFIRPGFRSQGYGSEVANRLLLHLSEDPRNRVAWGRVYLKNVPALRFWMRLGFTRVVEHKGQHVHLEGDHADIILERELRTIP